jgi:DNA end-binding protein Ku
MAKQLVEGMSREFKPERFKDTYRADLKRRVQEKIRKKQTHSLDSEPAKASDRPKAQVIDLMDALRASLKHRGKAPLRANPKKSHRSRVRA